MTRSQIHGAETITGQVPGPVSATKTSSKKRGSDVYVLDGKITAIQWAHYQLHLGNSFNTSHIFTSVAAGAYVYLLLQTNSEFSPHLNFEVTATSQAVAEFYEEPTITGNGTAIDIIALNRKSTNTTDTLWYHTPTQSALGTKLAEKLAIGGTGPQSIGGSASGNVRREFEWILKAETKYLFRIQNQASSGTDSIQFEASWYQVDPDSELSI